MLTFHDVVAFGIIGIVFLLVFCTLIIRDAIHDAKEEIVAAIKAPATGEGPPIKRR